VRGVAVVALTALLGLTGCGGGGDDGGGASGEQAFKAVETQVAAGARAAAQRAAPRWEPVRTLSGSGTSSATVEIASNSIQWRARWSCTAGDFGLDVNGRRFGDTTCPGRKTKTAIETGAIDLDVQASGPWRILIEQQVDTPLHQPPLPGMSSATELASGPFYKMERRGNGTARLYRLSSGRLALRFEGFETAGNPQLFVWLSTAPRPRTTKQVLNAPHDQIGLLKSTLGEQNYILPADISQDSIRSVAIWCKPIQIAYTAASLSG
jgi:Electron transfer DM13